MMNLKDYTQLPTIHMGSTATILRIWYRTQRQRSHTMIGRTSQHNGFGLGVRAVLGGLCVGRHDAKPVL